MPPRHTHTGLITACQNRPDIPTQGTSRPVSAALAYQYRTHPGLSEPPRHTHTGRIPACQSRPDKPTQGTSRPVRAAQTNPHRRPIPACQSRPDIPTQEVIPACQSRPDIPTQDTSRPVRAAETYPHGLIPVCQSRPDIPGPCLACQLEGGGGGNCPAVEQIASPVTGICPRIENLKCYVNHVHCNLLAWIKLLTWKMGYFSRSFRSHSHLPWLSQNYLDEAL